MVFVQRNAKIDTVSNYLCVMAVASEKYAKVLSLMGTTLNVMQLRFHSFDAVLCLISSAFMRLPI